MCDRVMVAPKRGASGLAGTFEHRRGGRNKVGKGEATMTRREGKGVREWFYAGFTRRICMVIICGAHASTMRCRDDAERERGEGCVTTREEETTAATIGAARFV